MVDLVIVPANVKAGGSASLASGQAGETIAAGKLVYQSSTTKKWMLCDTNAVDLEARKPQGIALNGAALDQPVDVLRGGEITVGTLLTAGDAYYASDTPGGICPRADVTTGENVALVGLAKSTSVLVVDIQVPGVVL